MEAKKKAEEKKEVVRLGLIYDVEYQRFDKVYRDLTTGRIRIECSCDEADQEATTTISAA